MKQNVRILSIIGVLAVVVLVAFFLFSRRSAENIKPVSNGTPAEQAAVTELLSEVSKLMALPEGESPTVATVIEPEKLRSQPFFANTKTDDRVLIYMNARKAILYRPSEQRIIEVAPLVIGDPSSLLSGSATGTIRR